MAFWNKRKENISKVEQPKYSIEKDGYDWSLHLTTFRLFGDKCYFRNATFNVEIKITDMELREHTEFISTRKLIWLQEFAPHGMNEVDPEDDTRCAIAALRGGTLDLRLISGSIYNASTILKIDVVGSKEVE